MILNFLCVAENWRILPTVSHTQSNQNPAAHGVGRAHTGALTHLLGRELRGTRFSPHWAKHVPGGLCYTFKSTKCTYVSEVPRWPKDRLYSLLVILWSILGGSCCVLLPRYKKSLCLSLGLNPKLALNTHTALA